MYNTVDIIEVFCTNKGSVRSLLLSTVATYYHVGFAMRTTWLPHTSPRHPRTRKESPQNLNFESPKNFVLLFDGKITGLRIKLHKMLLT